MELWGQFVGQYLRKLQLPRTMEVCTKEWNHLFNVATSRLVIFECGILCTFIIIFARNACTACQQNFLLDFIKKVGELYRDSKRECQFTQHLLMLKVPKLFLVQEKTADADKLVIMEFKAFMRNYIIHNGCSGTVYQTLMVSKYLFN